MPVSVTTDSKLDIVVADASGFVDVLLNDGSGVFGPATSYAVGGSPAAVTTADVSGDGIPDIVVADFNGVVEILLGVGNGGFGPATPYAVGGMPVSVTTADLNGDGKLDIVVADAAGGASVLLNSSTTPGVFSISHVGATPGRDTGIVVDTTAPAVTVALGSDTGTSTSDNLTNTATVSGSGDPNAVVTLTEAGSRLGTTTADAIGAWNFTPALTDGTHTITASETDAAGNNASTSLTFTLDITAPVVAASATKATTEATSAFGASVTFTASVTDVHRTTDPVTFSENGSPVASGDTFSIGHHTIVAAATDAAGNPGQAIFSFDVVGATPPAVTAALVDDTGDSPFDSITSNATISGTGEANMVVTLKEGVTLLGTTVADGTGAWTFTPTLRDGVHIVTASETDASGRTGSASLTFTLDTQAPTVKEVLATDTGSSTSDGITSVATVFGTADRNATVTLTDGTKFLGTTTASFSGDVWAFTPTLTDGAHTITASETDVAGNVGSASVSLTLDTTAPTVSIGQPVISTTNSGMVTASGEAEAGSLVQLIDGTVGIGTTTAGANGIWSLAVALASGAHMLSATARDTAGNISNPVTAPQIVIAAPLTPDLDAASDKGISNTDNITNVNTPVFIGSGAEAGAAVDIFDTDGTRLGHIDHADASGNWRITSSKLSDGVHTITAKQTDSAGNTSTTSTLTSLNVTIDTVAPTTPAIPDLTAASDSGTSSIDNITNVSTPTFTGTADPGTLVQVLFDGGAEVSAITTLTNGSWTTPASVFVPSDGAHTVVATAMDVAGNLSGPSASLSFTLDRVAPKPPTYASLTANADGSVKLTGSAEANTTVAVFDGTTQIGVTSSNGAWSFTTAAHLPDTLHVFLSRATDVAGNVGVISGSSGSAQFGSTKADTIQSTVGNDLMTGGAGADTFKFLAGFGKDIINDFAATGTVHDVINFHANPVLNSFANVLSHSVQSGANVVISQDASNTLTLKNVALPNNPPPNSSNILSSTDFTFV